MDVYNKTAALCDFFCDKIVNANPHTLEPILCDFVANTKADLDSHKQKEHDVEKPLWCPICSVKITQYYGFMKHVILHNGTRLPKYDEYKFECNHTIERDKETGKKVKCRMRFLCEDKLTIHKSEKHTGKKIVLYCKYCKAGFGSITNKRQHEKRHLNKDAQVNKRIPGSS